MKTCENDILLAEDDSDDVEIFESALKELLVGYELRHAKDGVHLFRLLSERIPDVLFLDHHMPCKDGLECLLEIRREAVYDKMPIIMYSSQTISLFTERAYKHGANRFLGKPETFSDIVEKMRLIFQKPWSEYIPTPSFEKFVI